MKIFCLPPIVMLFSAGVMFALNRYLPMHRFWSTPYSWIGILCIGFGLGISFWHARLFKKLGTNINTFDEPGTLTQRGLFGISRNPMYLGFVITLLGVAIFLGTASPFLIVLGFILLTNYWYIPFEEKAMFKKFGQEYIDYQGRVRRWF